MVTPSGGTGPYTYLWGDGETTQTAIGLSAGVNTVRIYDANSCGFGTASVTIDEPAVISGVAAQVSSVTCNGGSNGSAMVTPSGGTGPYTYLWGMVKQHRQQ